MPTTAERDLLAPDLDNYRGRWVAIKDGAVVASGHVAADVMADLKRRHIVRAALFRVPEKRDSAFVL
jgi:hypothetical protein